MSDDLVKRLRETTHMYQVDCELKMKCADRIEELEDRLVICERYRDAYAELDRISTQAVRELEAKLAKAMETLDEALYFIDIDEEDLLKQAGTYWIAKSYVELGGLIPSEWSYALKRVAELTGGRDD